MDEETLRQIDEDERYERRIEAETLKRHPELDHGRVDLFDEIYGYDEAEDETV